MSHLSNVDISKEINSSDNAMLENKDFICHFNQKHQSSLSDLKNLLGGKGANLAEMSRLGFPVPPGFTLSTKLCQLFYDNDKSLSEDIKTLVKDHIKQLEEEMGSQFNNPKNPLLLSVRSGAPVSMPGMMDTILNLGLNENTVVGLAELSKDSRFAWDSYRRFVQMYSNVVMGMNSSLLEVQLEDYKNQKSLIEDTDLTAKDWETIIAQFKDVILQETGKVFPEDPWEQLWESISAVFNSWNNPRAIIYRKMNGKNSCKGTAVNIQTMVFGNKGEDCATGVVFTRNPSTGQKALFGEFLINAQGEDVVAGTKTPQLIIKNKKEDKDLKDLMPNAFDQLLKFCEKLEKHYKYVQDIEFTIEKNKLWLLQTRDAKCSCVAQLKILFDLLEEGLITEEEALLKVEPTSLNSLLHQTIDENAKKTVIAKGLPASPGGAIGKIVFSNEQAVSFSEKGLPVILVRTETSPEDINGMLSSQGILTSRGGMTSHAAVVTRSMGKPCIVGCESLLIDEKAKELKIKNTILKEGDDITINGSTGEVYVGVVGTKAPHLDKYFFKLMEIADKHSQLEVRANADTVVDVTKSKDFGAKGVGLCRTEHMFFAADRINIMRKMILAEGLEERQEALDELVKMQQQDFYDLLKIMDGYPVTIRFLDPPLHEFLPHTKEDIERLSKEIEWSEEKISTTVKLLKEANPMLGHRGCRLAITFPEIYLMQAKAVAEACVKLQKEGKNPQPEIMIPLVCLPEELQILRQHIEKELQKISEETKVKLSIPIGTMIELPRACLEASKVADHADFFSFGTNDLTQTTLGVSRDDSNKFLSSYINQKLFEKDPFSSIDVNGVGELVKIAIDRGRKQKTNLKMGVCGEHGGDPQSIQFFNSAGLDYISCSPYNVPIARLASAQAKIRSKKER